MSCRTCSRRSVLHGIGVAAAGGLLALGCGGGGAGPDAGMMGTPDADPSCAAHTLCLDLTKPANAPLANVGGSIYVEAGGDRLIVVRASDTTVDALSSICTHAGCTVGYSKTRMDLSCPCHGSQFNLNGSVARGPAAFPLKTYTATLDAANNLVTIAIG